MRRAARTDTNHREIVDAFRKCGWLVMSLTSVGRGVPDLLVQKGRWTWLVEVKTPTGKLKPSQKAMQAKGWDFVVVRSVDDVVAL